MMPTTPPLHPFTRLLGHVLVMVAAAVAIGLGGLAGCGSGTDTDGEDDPGGVRQIEGEDLTATRGDPIALGPPLDVEGNLLGVSASHAVVTDPACELDAGSCEYRWLTDTGQETASLSGMAPMVRGFVSSDAALMSLMVNGTPTCSAPHLSLFQGDLTVVDVSSGATRWSLPGLHFEPMDGQAFTNLDDWVFASYATEDPCLVPPDERATQCHVHSVTDASATVDCEPYWDVVELPDGRWLGVRDEGRLVLLDPAAPSNYDILYDGPGVSPGIEYVDERQILVSLRVPDTEDAWLYLRHDILTGTNALYTPPVGMRVYPSSSSWVYACQQETALPLISCVAHHMLGEFADASFSVFGDTRSVALVGQHQALYYVGALSDTDQAASVIRLELTDGSRDVLLEESGVLNGLMGSPRVLFWDSGAKLWVLDETGARLLAEEVVHVELPPSHSAEPIPASAEPDPTVVIIARHGLASHRISLWHDPTEHLVHLSNSLYFDDGSQAFFHCGKPRIPFSMVMNQSPGRVFFAELDLSTPDQVTLLLAPSDGSAPPQLLQTVPRDSCIPPYVSAGGERVAVFVKDPVATSGQLTLGAL